MFFPTKHDAIWRHNAKNPTSFRASTPRNRQIIHVKQKFRSGNVVFKILRLCFCGVVVVFLRWCSCVFVVVFLFCDFVVVFLSWYGCVFVF